MNKHKLQSLMGVIGGVFFMAGDCLIYCYKGTTGGEIDPLWVDVAMWRFVLSEVRRNWQSAFANNGRRY